MQYAYVLLFINIFYSRVIEMKSIINFFYDYFSLFFLNLILKLLISIPIIKNNKSILKTLIIFSLLLLTPIILVETILVITFLFLINLPNFPQNIKINKIRKRLTEKYNSKEYFIIFNSKKRNSFYEKEVINHLRKEIKVLWIDRKLYKNSNYTNNEEVTDILNLLKTKIYNFNYPIYISIKNTYFIHYNIKDILFQFEKGMISIEEFIHEINNFDYNYTNITNDIMRQYNKFDIRAYI